MKKRFYYNGNLMRTSETHTYTHALIGQTGTKPLMCSATREGCEKEKRRLINIQIECIQNANARLRALETGRTKYQVKDGRHYYYNNLPTSGEERKKDEKETLEWIEKYKLQIECLERLEIVELEER